MHVAFLDDDFVSAVQDATDGRDADVVLDVIGAKYLARNISVLAPGGRLVVTWVLRAAVRRAGLPAVRRHWPGTDAGLATLCRPSGLANQAHT